MWAVYSILLLTGCDGNRRQNTVAASFHAEEAQPDFQLGVGQRAAAEPLVRQPYSGINQKEFNLFRLTRPADGYLSYRVGNRIFWTRQRLYLKPGEIWLGDGQKMIANRGGNRSSLAPRQLKLPQLERKGDDLSKGRRTWR